MSDTPRTDDVHKKYRTDVDPLDKIDALDSLAMALERELAAAQKENDTLRGLLGNSAKDCIYCGLPATEQARCPSGFPGCSRSDDQMLSQHFADGYRADEAEKELAAVQKRVAELERLLAVDAAELARRRQYMGTTLQEVFNRAENAERDAERLRWCGKNWYRAVDLVHAAMTPFTGNMTELHARVCVAIDKEFT